jgi:adenylate cyclase
VITASTTVVCRSPLPSMWDAVSDTERLNRAVGLEPIKLIKLADESAGRFLAKTRLGGFPTEYVERPFEWILHERFRVFRQMSSGPLRSIETTFSFAPRPRGEPGCELTVDLRIDPRITLLTPIFRLSAEQTLHKMNVGIRAIDLALLEHAPPFRADAREYRPSVDARVERLSGQVAKPIRSRLIRLLDTADDATLARLRPYELADDWGEPRREVLQACLHAVSAGLLELRWEVICPSCRTASEDKGALAELSEHGDCHLCDVRFALDVDDAVEATFRLSPAVRAIETAAFCVGGPARVPHVVAQVILPPSGAAVLVAPEKTGTYRVFVRGGALQPIEVVASGPDTVQIDSRPRPADALQKLTVAPKGSIVVQNAEPFETHAKLEHLAWPNRAATGRDVTALPEFRRAFSSDVLRAGVSLRVSRVGLLFSDLTDSTKLYATVGDAAAFRLVQDHFEVVVALIEKHGGAVVKTIGDAVMAVFVDDLDGVRASVAILEAFETFRDGHEHRRRTHIKLGFFAGSAYAVTANGILDYFGQTVNVAARLQGAAASGELILEQALVDRAAAEGALGDARGRVRVRITERFEASLKGVEGALPVARVALAPRPPGDEPSRSR